MAASETMREFVQKCNLSEADGGYAESEMGEEACKVDCAVALQAEFDLTSGQAQEVVSYVFWDGYERGWEAEWDRYARFAWELGELARKVLDAA